MNVCEVCGLPLEVGFFGCIKTIRPHGLMSMRVVDDSVPGGFVIENLSAQPQTFYSKSEYREAMRVAHVKNEVRHRPPPGSDKSKFTQRFV